VKRSARRALATISALALAGACASLVPTEFDGFEWQPPSAPAARAALAPREACAETHPEQRAFFGDLHVHTGFSFDAASRGLVTTPDDAYRFARGERIDLGPFDAQGRGTRSAQLERALDFAAVTDHAEWLAEVALCTRPDSPAYDARACRIYRGEQRSLSTSVLRMLGAGSFAKSFSVVKLGGRKPELCGEDGAICRAWAGRAWQDTRDAAERHYDRSSACAFTTFQAWEYSRSPAQSKVHRNVILRNEIAPELPISFIDAPTALELWEKLDARCNATGSGCEALAIPHNPNLSNGRMFTLDYLDEPREEQLRRARLRAALEPIVEMTQIKGDSECAPGRPDVLGDEDELCGYEKMRSAQTSPPEPCAQGEVGSGAMRGRGCESTLDFARYALVEGLRERERIGVNPYAFGMIGSTDTHNSTPGDVEEYSYDGCCLLDATTEERLATDESGLLTWPVRNPGGLVGVWAEENTRDALFDAMKRRETFATTGPRIEPRLFAGWDVEGDLCGRSDFASAARAQGVPMGGDLPLRPARADAAPILAVSALRDAGTPEWPGGKLQRIQIVKGWVGDDGATHQAIYDVAGDAANGASVDLATCTPEGPGFDALCSVWRDPDFDASRSAVYYARAVENPSCRWSTWECLRTSPDARPALCSDPAFPKTIQERAITSPVWYHPDGGGRERVAAN